MLICNHWFHAVFIRQSSGRKRKILKKSKNTVKRTFTLELRITLFFCLCMYVCKYVCMYVCVDYICALCVLVYVIVSMCVCMIIPAPRCLMNMCTMCNKNQRKSRYGWRFGQIKSLLCKVMILTKGQIYHHHYIMKKINF